MKRDMDLIRDLLLYFREEAGGRKNLPVPSVKRDGLDVSKDEVNYHIKLLNEAKLIEATKLESGWVVHSLTWSGHEFLDAAQDEGRWKKAKEIVKEKGGGLGLDVFRAVLIQLVREAMGMH